MPPCNKVTRTKFPFCCPPTMARNSMLRLCAEINERGCAAEENYRSIFENAVEGIFQSTAEGRFITCNPSLARILGYDSPEEVIASVTDIGRQLYVDAESRREANRQQSERGVLSGFEFEA